MKAGAAERTGISPQERSAVKAALRGLHVPASAALVNRTQRVVREQALAMQARRRRARDLWLAGSICSALFVMLLCGLWAGLSQYDLLPSGESSAAYLNSSYQMMVLAAWFVPAVAGAALLVWFKRGRGESGGSVRPGKNYRDGAATQIVR